MPLLPALNHFVRLPKWERTEHQPVPLDLAVLTSYEVLTVSATQCIFVASYRLMPDLRTDCGITYLDGKCAVLWTLHTCTALYARLKASRAYCCLLW